MCTAEPALKQESSRRPRHMVRTPAFLRRDYLQAFGVGVGEVVLCVWQVETAARMPLF